MSIRYPITAICKCGHKWSWHYIDSNNNKCYAHEIEGGNECNCNGYGELRHVTPKPVSGELKKSLFASNWWKFWK